MASGGEGSGRSRAGKSPAPRGRRERVRSGKLKESSRRWMERHINDPFVRQARAEGWRSRSAFKLIEADDRYGLLEHGRPVIDLGAAPGGWTQVAAKRTRSPENSPHVVGVDLLAIEPVPGAVLFQHDFLDDDAEALLLDALGTAPGLVMSDMAAATVGHRKTDHLRTMHLAEIAADFALRALEPGGDLLMKTFQGGTEAELLDRLKRDFRAVHHFKPASSRKESPELYLLARGRKG